MSNMWTQGFLFFLSVCFASGQDLGGDRIVGGKEVVPYSVPHQVALIRRGSISITCGGFIYDKNHIITAGHCCMYTPLDYYEVIAGEHNLMKDEGAEQRRNPIKIIEHENHIDATNENDMCLIAVDKPFDLSKPEVAIPKFPEPFQEFESGVPAFTTGWGYTSGSSFSPSPVLLGVDVTILSDEECQDLYGDDLAIPEHFICAAKPGKDTCGGDSGGPLLCEDTLCGVTSGGFDCASPIYPGFYMQFSYFIDWIEDNLVL